MTDRAAHVSAFFRIEPQPLNSTKGLYPWSAVAL